MYAASYRGTPEACESFAAFYNVTEDTDRAALLALVDVAESIVFQTLRARDRDALNAYLAAPDADKGRFLYLAIMGAMGHGIGLWDWDDADPPDLAGAASYHDAIEAALLPLCDDTGCGPLAMFLQDRDAD